MSSCPTTTTSYPCPDELDKMIDELRLSPEMERWCISTIVEYRMVATTLMNLYTLPKKETTE